MNIYISGISGTGLGPLALMAKKAGYRVFGSDLAQGAIYDELVQAGIEVYIGEQDGSFLKEKMKEGVDWFCYTSALPKEHAELALAREAGIKCTKRDDFTAFLVEKLGLKMIAVAGTHGKTTTTAMIVWAALKLGLPASYIVGTTLHFAPSGAYHEGDKYFIYEADEYDRNFLKYHPWLAVIPSVSYDHPDIYKTREVYLEAFSQFESQSESVIRNTAEGIVGDDDFLAIYKPEDFGLAGEARRIDAALAANAVKRMQFNEYESKGIEVSYNASYLISVLNEFPGVGRRFEKISEGLYTDYAHHPEEIAATIKMALEEAKLTGRKGVVAVYEPHQNTRQHEVREGYKDAFLGVDKIFWLPTYLVRENPNLAIISPREFIKDLENSEIAETSEVGEDLGRRIREYLSEDYLVLLMTAGPADGWLRREFLG
ncbi:hypothetical protein J6S37_00305 [Candidatus Saccharibacteria bacterium]|nr:hypothetical protein [Candidatus Saccharibacteria bacterium]